MKCTYCGTDVVDGGVFMDDAGTDGVFCNDTCAELYRKGRRVNNRVRLTERFI